MAYTRISDKFKQQNAEGNVSKNALFYIVNSTDVHFAINAFQHQIDEMDESFDLSDENQKFIVTDPYNLPSGFEATPVGDGSGLSSIYNVVVGTGDIIESIRTEMRESYGTTFMVLYDASNQGEKTEESLGNLGHIVFNNADKKHYGWNGTTWADFATDYVKSVVQVGGNITITKGSGEETNIPIGVTVGVSGDGSPILTQKFNFVQGNNMDINISAVGDTADVEFAVNRVIAGTMST